MGRRTGTIRAMKGGDDLDRIAAGIRAARDAYAARERGEALMSISVGAAIIPIVYLVGAWGLSGLWHLVSYGRLPPLGIWSPPMLALGVLWFGFGALMAWRQVHPFSALQPLAGKPYDPYLDPPPVRLADADDERIGTRLTSILRVAASGPANILEGIAQLRDIPTLRDEDLRRAAELLALAASSDGLGPAKVLRDEIGARAMAHLHRLKLILREGSVGPRVRLRATTSGRAIAEARRP